MYAGGRYETFRVRDTGLHYPWFRKKHDLQDVCVGSPCPQVTGDHSMELNEHCTHSRLASQLSSTELREPILLQQEVSSLVLCPTGRHHLISHGCLLQKQA